ncbi:MAG: radical SAM protein [Anaerolineae bacterium]|nr:radical SAM protein [Anaerolineae bacterium]
MMTENAPPPLEALSASASELVNATREYVFIRPEDRLIILRPNRLHHLSETALFMLQRLYDPEHGPDVPAVIQAVVKHYGAEEGQVRHDLGNLLATLSTLLQDVPRPAPSVRLTPYGSHKRELPVLSEIALTYRCQNRCTFCYADAPRRGRAVSEMTTAEVKIILDRIYDEAHCPTVSFTGGEPTLRDDLPELIAYGRAKGLRVNLITNGIRCADPDYVSELAQAGLHSAQVSLEGGAAEIHDAITQHPGSWDQTVAGIANLRRARVHTHTNTTVCGGNRDHLMPLVDFIAEELRSEYFSMNMVIRTGTALAHGEDDISYAQIGAVITAVQAHAKEKGVHLEWYSPVPYCLFNPVQAGLGSKSCACVHGLLSVNPAGELLPCSSFERGIGDLLHEPFDKVWYSRTALYWRRKEFLPPTCARCSIKDICCGACPLYWDERRGFSELKAVAPTPPLGAGLVWRLRKALWSGTWGVGLRRDGRSRGVVESRRDEDGSRH